MAGAFNELLEELFEPVGGVSLRRMFGGIGVFKDGVMFGLVDDDILYLKADDATRPRFEAEGSEPWVYQGRHRANVSTAYWRIPERLFDDTDEFAAWARTASEAAVRAKDAKTMTMRKSKTKIRSGQEICGEEEAAHQKENGAEAPLKSRIQD
jgi:DNA transformation protein and related proteins